MRGGVREVVRKQDVVFKGGKDGLQLIFNDKQDFQILKEKLETHLQRAELFFQGADVILDVGNLELPIEEILEVQNILAFPHGLRLKKIVRGVHEPSKNKPAFPDVVKSQRRTVGKARTIEQREKPVEYWAGASTMPDTVLYKGTLRSGQRLAHEGNVVIVGDVNPGAEVKASGDIVIMGTLRGLAHAGVGGAIDVVIVAFRLEPTQIRIGDIIGRPPEGDLGIPREPEVARLRDGVILVEPLDGSRWEGER